MAKKILIEQAKITNRQLVLVIIICLLSSFLFKLTAYGQGQNTGEPDLILTILHTNDLHSHDESFTERGRNIGGMARIAHLIRTIRKNTPNVLTIDAGDIFEGTPFFKFYHGAVEVALLNMIGYDIYTPGNHEFDDGPDNLTKQLQLAKFDVISANLDTSAKPDLAKIVKPSVIKIVDGRKVGFVGAMAPDLEQLSLTTGKVHVKESGSNWIQPIKQEVERLKAEGITRIILVTHVGLERDKELAQAIPDVDAIIGGHSHTRLDAPAMVTHADGSQTAIVQTGCYGRALGKIRLVFDAHGHIIPADLDYHLINITDRIFADTDISKYIAERAGPVHALANKFVGVALADFDNRFKQCPWDSQLGDLVCDALADAGTAYGATIAFENRGGMRSRIEKGPISMEAVEDTLPFENHLILATVSGKVLLQALQHSISRGLGGPFFDVHGLKIAYDPDRPGGSRIVFVMAQDERGRWHDIVPESKYKIAINDYSFNGGEGFDFSGAVNQFDTKERLSTFLANYLIKKKKVKPVEPLRIVPVTNNLLSVTKQNGKQILQVKSGMPRAHVTLLTGSWPGVESVHHLPPVPLTGAHVVAEDVVADEFGDCSWQLPLIPHAKQSRHSYQKHMDNADGDEKWAAVIVHSGKGKAAGQTKISYPVALNADMQLKGPGGYPLP